MAKTIPFPAHHDFAPLDISYLFEDEKPAGKHGYETKPCPRGSAEKRRSTPLYADGRFRQASHPLRGNRGEDRTGNRSHQYDRMGSQCGRRFRRHRTHHL